MDYSNLRLYSLGIVVETKPEKTNIILVCPIEQFYIQGSGNIKSHQSLNEGKLKDSSNKGFDTEMKSSNYLKAKWIPLGHSNRTTSPDVVANETVMLFKYADVDEYYWTTCFNEPSLRRLESVTYSFSNLKSGMEPFDSKTSYWFRVDTKNKKVHFHTASNDGEHTEYDIIFDTKEGTFILQDKKGNKIFLNSKTNIINVEANNVINAKAPTINCTAVNIVLTGNVTINGNTVCNGGISSNGNIISSGNIKAEGSIIDGGGNTNHHSH